MKAFQVLAALSLLCFLGNSEAYSDNITPAELKRLVTQINSQLPSIISICKQKLQHRTASQEAWAGLRIHKVPQGAYRKVQHVLGSSTYVRLLTLGDDFQALVLKAIRKKFGLSKKSLKKLIKLLGNVLSQSACPFPEASNITCDATSGYRTQDGSCNNLKHPYWGRALRPFQRLLYPDYADGIEEPRDAGGKGELPSARLVSREVSPGEVDKPAPIHTILLAFTGQFLDHDLTRTAGSVLQKPNATGPSSLVDIECGSDGCQTTGDENRECYPISIPPNDSVFTTKKCLMFVRSASSPRDNCRLGPREQINQITAHVDASHIYGSSDEENGRLRNPNNSDRGRLRVHKDPLGHKPVLPFHKDKDCKDFAPDKRCFAAGDSRVNEQVGLATLHTVWHRYHNVIERKLHKLNPHWAGEKLYQESKKIVAAVWQRVIYREFLPTVLGPDTMKRFSLELLQNGFSDGYDAHVNPEIFNGFATAAFRFGHTMIPPKIPVLDKKFELVILKDLSSVFETPEMMYQEYTDGTSSIDGLLRGQIAYPMQIIDRFLTSQLTAHLFSEEPPHGLGTDLLSLNIQRGRDHGIPGYIAWRRYCGLKVPKNSKGFNRLRGIPKAVRKVFEKLYKSINDIDLFPAAISEKPVPGGIVGPTLACILGIQFHHLKVGDRFWHETNDKVTGFTSAQLEQIRKANYARVICDAADDIGEIQKFPILQPVSEAFKNLKNNNKNALYDLASLYRGSNNKRVSCNKIDDINLKAWKEAP